MSILQEEVSRLIEPMLQQRFYVVFSTMVQPLAALKSLLPDHLRYLIALEQRGVLFASGPHFDADGSLEGNSMTIVRAGSLECRVASY